jgi:hypothetical protein
MEQKLTGFQRIPEFAQQAALDIIKNQVAIGNARGPDRQIALTDLSNDVKNAITSLYVEKDIPAEKPQYMVKNEYCELEFVLPTYEDFKELFNQVTDELKNIPSNSANRMHLAGLIMKEVERRVSYKIGFEVKALYPE